MAATAIPAVREAVIDALEGIEALSGVELRNGGTEPTQAREWLWIVKADAKNREFKVLQPAPTPIDETVTLHLMISVVGGGKAAEQAAAELRATEILDAVDTVLRADNTLGGTVFSHKFADLEQLNRVVDGGFRATWIAPLTCKTRT